MKILCMVDKALYWEWSNKKRNGAQAWEQNKKMCSDESSLKHSELKNHSMLNSTRVNYKQVDKPTVWPDKS